MIDKKLLREANKFMILLIADKRNHFDLSDALKVCINVLERYNTDSKTENVMKAFIFLMDYIYKLDDEKEIKESPNKDIFNTKILKEAHIFVHDTICKNGESIEYTLDELQGAFEYAKKNYEIHNTSAALIHALDALYIHSLNCSIEQINEPEDKIQESPTLDPSQAFLESGGSELWDFVRTLEAEIKELKVPSLRTLNMEQTVMQLKSDYVINRDLLINKCHEMIDNLPISPMQAGIGKLQLDFAQNNKLLNDHIYETEQAFIKTKENENKYDENFVNVFNSLKGLSDRIGNLELIKENQRSQLIGIEKCLENLVDEKEKNVDLNVMEKLLAAIYGQLQESNKRTIETQRTVNELKSLAPFADVSKIVNSYVEQSISPNSAFDVEITKMEDGYITETNISEKFSQQKEGSTPNE